MTSSGRGNAKTL